MRLVNKIIVRFFDKYNNFWKRYRRLKFNLNARIVLGDKIDINPNAEIDTTSGGLVIIGNNTEILEGVLIKTYGGNITIGANCSINPYTIIYGHNNTKIGNNVLIAGHCMIIPNKHIFENKNELIRDQGCAGTGIIIEDDVWIGHGCSILDAVVIGKGAVIAAGCVVNKNIEPYSINAGVPARRIGFRK